MIATARRSMRHLVVSIRIQVKLICCSKPWYRMRKCGGTLAVSDVAMLVAMVIWTRFPSDTYACLMRCDPLQMLVSRPDDTSRTTARRRQNDVELETLPCMTSRSRGDDVVDVVKSYSVRLTRRPTSASITYLK